MGNRTTKLTWTWPLISYKWIPQILSSFDKIIEPTWAGLHREMSTYVINKSFSKKLTQQIKNFLTETFLIQENRKHIKSTINPSYRDVRNHLLKICNNGFDFSCYYSFISENRLKLSYHELRENPPKHWPQISDYSIFKQWGELYQYLGLGILIETYYFIPTATITKKMATDIRFIEASLKTTGDPRLLTGQESMHQECDFFAWSRGEDKLPLTADPKIIPRIPTETIINQWEKHRGEPDAWLKGLTAGKEEWYEMVNCLLFEKISFDLVTFIYTCKILLDTFLFGKLVPNDDFLDVDQIYRIQKRWESVKYFVISNNFWKILPRLYKDITRLFWGIFYLRTSLQKPNFTPSFNNSIFETKFDSINSLNIRCLKSKRSFHGIYKFFSMLYKSLNRLQVNNIHLEYKSQSNDLYNELKSYLPSNTLDLAEIIKKMDQFVILSDEAKTNLMNNSNFEVSNDCPPNPILGLCYWVNAYHDMQQLPQSKAIGNIKGQIKIIKKKYLNDIRYYEKDLNDWNMACENLKKLAASNRLLQK